MNFVFLDWLYFENTEIGVVAHRQVAVGRINVAESLSTLILGRLFASFDLHIGVRLDISCHFEGVEDISALDPTHKIIFNYISFIKFVSMEVVLSHVAVVLGLFEFLQSFDDIG